MRGGQYLNNWRMAEIHAKEAPARVNELEAWGAVFDRTPDGRILQRNFGGHRYPRLAHVGDRTGLEMIRTLQDHAVHLGIDVHMEVTVIALLTDGNRVCGAVAYDREHGRFRLFHARAVILATGGVGRAFSVTSNSWEYTADGQMLAYNAGAALQDMEFVQFHPSGLIPSGILITEGARADGGVLLNRDGERFMGRYAPEKLELASRDVVSRAIVTEMEEGRGFKDEASGYDYVELDLTKIGAEKVKARLAGIREIAMKFTGIDPVERPLPVRPVCHYMMGGLDVDMDGATGVKGLWAAGEAACVSINGANRLGANSTAECLVWGRITGAEAARHAVGKGPAAIPKEQVMAEEKRIFDGIFHGRGGTNPYDVRDSVQRAMEKGAFVYRTREGLLEATKAIQSLRESDYLHCDDHSKRYNTNLTNVLEVEAMLMAAEAILRCAVARTESRGAHARRDFPKRDDANWLKHSLAFYSAEETEGGHVRLGYSPVKITRYQPAERHY